jgi:hypothetical protein
MITKAVTHIDIGKNSVFMVSMMPFQTIFVLNFSIIFFENSLVFLKSSITTRSKIKTRETASSGRRKERLLKTTVLLNPEFFKFELRF